MINVDYLKLFSTRAARAEEFKGVEFKLLNYVVYTQVTSDSNHKEYYIEFQNSDGKGIFEIFSKDVWVSLKNYLQIGLSAECNSCFCFDEMDKLCYIKIDSFNYKDIYVSKEELITPKGKVRITRTLFEDKIIIVLLCGFLGLIPLATIYPPIFLTLAFIDILVLLIYVVIKNKRMGYEVGTKLEEMCLQKIEQEYIKKDSNSKDF